MSSDEAPRREWRNLEICRQLEAGASVEVVARKYGLSRERIRQIKLKEQEEISIKSSLKSELDWKYIDTRIHNVLRNESITIEELADRPDRELLTIPNFGRLCLRRVRELTNTKDKPKPEWSRDPELRKLIREIVNEELAAHFRRR